MSDSLAVGLLLAFAGGMLDAYSFATRGEVFATAETGNMVRLAIHLSLGELAQAGRYILPIAAFTLGVLAAEVIRRKMDGRRARLHWRQAILLGECAVLAGVALLPAGPLDALANILISFTSAIQLESFRKFRGCAGSTTMCTGNLRSGTEQLYRFLALPDPQAWGKSSVYYRLILAFLAGAVVCGRLTLWWGTRTALCACLPLLAVFVLLFRPVRS